MKQKQISEGLSDLASGKTVDGSDVRKKDDGKVWHLNTIIVLRRKQKPI